jgi:hypothetical protein
LVVEVAGVHFALTGVNRQVVLAVAVGAAQEQPQMVGPILVAVAVAVDTVMVTGQWEVLVDRALL